MKLQDWLTEAFKQVEAHGGHFTVGTTANEDKLYWANKLCGEAGEFAEEINKEFLTGKDRIASKELEIGDVGITLIVNAMKAGIDFEAAVKKKMTDTTLIKNGFLIKIDA